MKAKLLSALTCGILAMGLVGCGSEGKTETNSTTKNEKQGKKAVKEAVVIRGTGAQQLSSKQVMIPLEKGKATLKVKLNGLEKTNEFSVSISEHLKDSDSTNSDTLHKTKWEIEGKENHSGSSKFEVPSQGNYDIGLGSDANFKGEWEVVIEQ